MTTKDKILARLESAGGEYISGTSLAKWLKISRNAVWKAIRSLISEGHNIESSMPRGYRLIDEKDILSVGGISSNIDDDLCHLFTFDLRESVGSTNSLLKEIASSPSFTNCSGGVNYSVNAPSFSDTDSLLCDNKEFNAPSYAPEGLVIATSHQSAGRGRLGRSFFSPENTGLYFSLLLRPQMAISDSVFITTAAASALCFAIEESFGIKPEIKWVNDLYYRGKKICGILTEANLDLATGALDYVILGVGVNLYPPSGGFPEEIRSIAGSLLDFERSGGRNLLLGRFLSHFWRLYKGSDKCEIAELYRKYNFTVGKKISVISGDSIRPALALSISDDCSLEVLFEDSGETAYLSSGEISIRHTREEK